MSIKEEMTSGFQIASQVAKPSASNVGGFYDAFFNQIIVVPKPLDFGRLVGDKTLSTEIFNAHVDVSKELAYIDSSAVGGITFDVSLPKTIERLGNYVFDVTANSSQIIQLDGDAVYNFTSLEEITQNITANALFVFKSKFNFVNLNTETYKYNTSIHKAYDGTEHRVQNIDNPRMSVFVNYQVKESERVEIEGWLNKSLGDVMGIPLYTQNVEVNSYVATNATTINCDTTKSLLQAGAIAFIQSGNTSQLIEIASLTDTEITLVNGVNNPYPQGSMINVIVQGYIPDGVSFNRLTSDISTVSFDFQVKDNDLLHLDKFDNSALPVYNGYKVFNIMADRANHNNNYSNEYEIISYNYGPRYIVKKLDFAEDTFQLVFKNFSKDELFKIKSLMNESKGRLNSFWMPTWTRDVEIKEPIADTDTQIFVKAGNFAANYSGGGYHIRIRKTDGTEFYREILDATTSINPNQETLTISSNLGVNLSVNDVEWIDFIKLVRFDSDSFQINVISDSYSEINLTMKRTK